MQTPASKDNHAYVIKKFGSYQSQHGEDKWLDIYFSQKRHGFFVEVGAYDGIILSNTYHFEKERGWSGILVEPDVKKAELCRENRANSRIFECAAVGSNNIKEVSFHQVDGGEVYSTINLIDSHRQRIEEYGLAHHEVKVRAMTLDKILAESQARRIDFVSIDVEEAEFEVLNGFDIKKWKPAIVFVESNSSERKPEIRDYFVRNGYVYFHSIVVNDFYKPVFGGAIVAKVIDHYLYKKSRKPDVEISSRRKIWGFFDRHLFWRFKRR